MKNEFDKLFESHYGISQEDLLSLDSLCSLIEEQMRFVKSSEKDILQEADYSKSQLSSLLTEIPDVPISELGFGDITTSASGAVRSEGNRKQLSMWTEKIRGSRQADLPRTLKSLSDFYESGLTFDKRTQPGGKIRTILSYLAFYKALTQIITGFNAASAGFTFEAFLAVLMGGTQIPTGSKTIADLTDKKGNPISLKLYAENGAKVDGSWTDLVNDLTETSSLGQGYMHYVVVMKDFEGDGLEQEGTLKWFRFSFDMINVMNILSNTKYREGLRLSLSFMEDAVEGDINVTSPERSSISIEELEYFFKEELQNRLGGSDTQTEFVNALVDKIDWAKNRDLYSGTAKTPGISSFYKERGQRKNITAIVDQTLEELYQNADVFDKETRSYVIQSIHDANEEIINYSRGYESSRTEALGQLEFADAQASVDYYNSIEDPEIKKSALKNTWGYLFKGELSQFHLARGDVYDIVDRAGDFPGNLFPEGQSDVKIGETKIGAKHVVEMLEKAKEEINNSVFEIISKVAFLKSSLDQYFAGALRDDKKAQDAVNTSQEIEGKTQELRPDKEEADETPAQMSLPNV